MLADRDFLTPQEKKPLATAHGKDSVSSLLKWCGGNLANEVIAKARRRTGVKTQTTPFRNLTQFFLHLFHQLILLMPDLLLLLTELLLLSLLLSLAGLFPF